MILKFVFHRDEKLSATAKIFRKFRLAAVNNFVNRLRTASENAVNSENNDMLARMLRGRDNQAFPFPA